MSKQIPKIEEVFGSKIKLHILNLLAQKQELNISAIAKGTSVNHARIRKHIQDLVDREILLEKRFGRIRIYMYNPTGKAATLVKSFLLSWQNERDVSIKFPDYG